MIKTVVKKITPEFAIRLWHYFLIAQTRQRFRSLSTAEAFSKIYRENLWGGNKGEFNSGQGSIGMAAEQYVDFVCSFIQAKKISSIVDVGCGDFRIGKKIAQAAQSYIGVDVVPELILHHTENYSSETTKFMTLDVVNNKLPSADMCLVRQVFQHLSNEEISSALSNCSNFKYLLITEHFPPINPEFQANLDKPHGPDTRLSDNSAVVISAAPFFLANVKEVLVVPLDPLRPADGESVRSFLYTSSNHYAAELLV